MGRPASRMSVFSPFLGEFLCGPAAGDSRTDDNCVIAWCRHFFSEGSGVAEAGANGIATVLRARNNLQFQFLGKADFRSVVTVNGNALEDFPEIAFQLGVGFRQRYCRDEDEPRDCS